MVVTSKVFLDERRQKADKTYPLKIRVTVDRKHKEIPLGVSILLDQWDLANRRVKLPTPNAKLINIKISSALLKVEREALSLDNAEQSYSAATVGRNVFTIRKENITFYQFAQKEIDNLMKAGRVGNAIAYRTATNRLVAFAGRNSKVSTTWLY